MQMVEDLEKYEGTMLVWSALGGGSISLPYLENEAFGEVDPRLRFYGFMNDSEFIAECNKRGIKVFGIVFEVQGWEFPVVLSEDGKYIKQMNVLRDKDQPHDWYGLREFSSGRHDGLFRTSLKDYYPDGIINSDGELVTDLWEEVAARTYKGEPVHARWVEVVGQSETCYQTCRNNPVWRNYMKKIIQIQIDAGVAGIQLDEAELPITSLGAGGCFCKDCRKQFTAYLKELRAAGKLSAEYDDIDLETFDYKDFINDNHYDFPNGAPLFKEYYDFQQRAVKKHFIELVDFARDYARRTQNREIEVSANFFNLMPVYYPMENTVDVLITEMNSTVFRQPHWYRYVAGYSNTKPVVIAENPYGGVIPELLEMLDKGRGYDLYRLLLLEAATYGCNMSIPYGGWMGNTIKDAFYPPRDVTEQVQKFLKNNERLYSKASAANTMVMYSYPSYYWREVTKDYTGDVQQKKDSILFYTPTDIIDENTSRLPFWEVVKELSDQQVLYDVKMFGDDELRVEDSSLEELAQYDLIVVPDCDILTVKQTEVLAGCVREGKRLLIFGRAGENVPGWLDAVKDSENVYIAENPDSKREALGCFREAFREAYDGLWQLRVDNADVGVHMQESAECRSVHLISYRYDEEADRIAPIPELNLSVRVPENITGVILHTIDGSEVKHTVEKDGDILHVKLQDMPLYLAVELC